MGTVVRMMPNYGPTFSLTIDQDYQCRNTSTKVRTRYGPLLAPGFDLKMTSFWSIRAAAVQQEPRHDIDEEPSCDAHTHFLRERPRCSTAHYKF
jgi:hypothetical protein